MYEDNQKHPHEREISAAMKRLVMDLPKVGFVQGHEMRDIWKTGDLGLLSILLIIRYFVILC